MSSLEKDTFAKASLVPAEFECGADVGLKLPSDNSEICEGKASENNENISERRLIRIFGTEAGMPAYSKQRVSLFPAVSPVTEIPKKVSGSVNSKLQFSSLSMLIFPEILSFLSVRTKSAFAV